MDREDRIEDEVTTEDIDPDQVLEGSKGKMVTVAVVGVTKHGTLYVGSSTPEPDLLLSMLRAAHTSLSDILRDAEQRAKAGAPEGATIN